MKNEDTKICISCGLKKPISEFPSYGSKQKKYKKRKCFVCFRVQRSKWKQYSDPEYIYNKYKKNANKRNIEFALTLKQFKSFENKNCRYCGELLDRIRLDRVDNNLGYLINNVSPCCMDCNMLKSSLAEDDFLKQINKIFKFQESKK